MHRSIAGLLAAGLLTGCAAVGPAPRFAVVADRPGCSTLARAFVVQDGATLSAEQVLNGVAACEARDRLGALPVDPNQIVR